MNLDQPPKDPAASLLPARFRRFVPLIVAVALGVVLFGFLSGIREPKPTERPHSPEATLTGKTPSAVTYSELHDLKIGPNANWDDTIAQLKYDRPGIFAPVVRTDEMKLAALADRAANRAFDGAPPTIPHPTAGLYAASCVACHGEGLKVGDKIASKMSHPYMSNCTQCHVEQNRGELAFDAPRVENTFAGVYRAGPGNRASAGAPPTIPHHTWLRENCNACHGLITRPGTRTTHPWLTSCTQCHASSATLDQVNFSGAGK